MTNLREYNTKVCKILQKLEGRPNFGPTQILKLIKLLYKASQIHKNLFSESLITNLQRNLKQSKKQHQ